MPEKMPSHPQQEVFGIPARPLVEAIDSADSLALLGRKSLLPPGVYQETLQTAVDVWPLVEDIQRGRSVGPEEVRPHAEAILDDIVTNPAVRDAVARKGDYSTARKLWWLQQFSGTGFVRDQAVPEIERRFPGQVKELLDAPDTRRHVERGLEAAQPYAEIVATYDDPQAQYVEELGAVTEEIREQTRQVRDARLAVEYARHPANTLRGKILRWRHRNKTLEELTKPIDAAHGIDRVLQKTLGERQEDSSIPLLRTIIDKALAETGHTTQDMGLPDTIQKMGVTISRAQMLEAAAPEIVQTLEAPLPEDRQDAQFLSSIQKRFSFKARMGRFFKSTDLSILRRRGPRFLRAVRDVLPRSGREVTRAMDEIREFFLT